MREEIPMPLVKLVLLVTLAGACQSAPADITQAKLEPEPNASVSSQNNELANSASSLAIALRDRTARVSLFSALQSSKTSEHKVLAHDLINEYASLLNSSLQRFGKGAGGELSIPGLLGQFELYAPLARDRKVWRVDSSYLVVVEVAPNIIIGFDSTGAPHRLDPNTPPATAVFVIARRESPLEAFRAIRETRPPQIQADTRSDPAGSFYVSADELPDCGIDGCDDNGGGSGGNGSNGGGGSESFPSTAISATAVWISDKAEPWFRGDPEIELWLAGTVQGLYHSVPPIPPTTAPTLGFQSGQFMMPISCSGRYGPNQFKEFDYNSVGFYYDHRILLEELDEFSMLETVKGFAGTLLHKRRLEYGPPFAILMIERDDGGECPKHAVNTIPGFIGIQVTLTFPQLMTTPSSRLVTLEPVGSIPDWLSFLHITNENDVMGYWSFSTWSDFENIPTSTWFYGSHGSLMLENSGITRYNVPPEVVY